MDLSLFLRRARALLVPFRPDASAGGAAPSPVPAPHGGRAALLPEIAASAGAPRRRRETLRAVISATRFGARPRGGRQLSPRAERRLAADPFVRRLAGLD
ncbi:hypothetical protein DLJ49_02125 [Rhodovulum sp. 12E13]|uniref:hypothetical protein n=1 Tax=Rhodovulum sp. 12E13 TaxID=2203891 RepID=UPI000E125EB8|nr:hypothetical protein [Rhodovulum sp. 12E13]RDC74802.1 hypothetical protein DLJ49_02125 [Rhodovulum sp. 12E13]